MNEFDSFGKALSSRYSRALEAADQQRSNDQQATNKFESFVQSGLDQEADGPVPPTESVMAEEEEEFDPEEAAIEDTKDRLIEQSKSRLSGMTGTQN